MVFFYFHNYCLKNLLRQSFLRKISPLIQNAVLFQVLIIYHDHINALSILTKRISNTNKLK